MSKKANICISDISIHAPSRERLTNIVLRAINSCISIHAPSRERLHIIQCIRFLLRFQSTLPRGSDLCVRFCFILSWHFNPRSLAGATTRIIAKFSAHADFNPRSLAGATSFKNHNRSFMADFNPRSLAGATSIKTNYFSIHLSQAFLANRLNSNTQEFYFDVRNLIVSHSSLSCEPKLNFMSHITSHRINLHYFSSCQSICK